jgi:hypothetical protein
MYFDWWMNQLFEIVMPFISLKYLPKFRNALATSKKPRGKSCQRGL